MSMKQKYQTEVSKQLLKELSLKNVMQTPKIEKVVLNMGIGSYVKSGNKDFSSLTQDLALIAWQQPVVRNARKAISNFKLRAGMPVGLAVTLRWDQMYAFLDRLVHVVLPRVRDFRGLNKKSFDADGNYNFWIKEHVIFPEVPQHDVVKTHGLQVTITMNTKDKAASRLLLEKLWFPFSK